MKQAGETRSGQGTSTARLAASEGNRDGNSDALLAAILRSAHSAIIGTDRDGTIHAWNGGAERLYGYAAAEAVGNRTDILLPHDRRDEEQRLRSIALAGDFVAALDTVRLRKDGTPVRVSLSVSPILDRGGEVVGASQIGRELIATAGYEQALAFLAAIVESSEDAIVGKTLDGIIQSWNAAAERLYGYSREEAIGRSMAMLLPPSRPDEEAEILARIRAGKGVDHFETVRRRSDGTLVNVALTISPVRNAAGKVIGASHVARDITERVRYEHARSHLAAIVESSEDAIVSKDLNGTILTWNSGAERIYGYTAEDITGRSIAILLPPDRRHEESDILERLKRGERVQHFETVRVRKDGTPIDVSLTISPIRDRNGVITGASHVARDITERKAFEAQLRQTQKLESLGVLAGGVAHDFNNLLTGILANASLAADTAADPDTARLLGDVVRAAERASGLTRQLLAYAGKGRFVSEILDVSALVEEISSLILASIPRKVRLDLKLTPGLPPVAADPGQIQQVIMNLVINGAEAIGDRSGTVTVTTRAMQLGDAQLRTVAGQSELEPGPYVVLEVRDDGCGMDSATLSCIFDPFFTTKFAGRGLGLAAVLGIVKGHKGALNVHSTPGSGTLFQVMLPAAAHASHAAATPPQPAMGAGIVLVVDDEKTVREAARNTLERYGYTVLTAETGRQAVEMVQSHPELDLVLLDLTMPEMSGEEALERIRDFRPSLRVLLSSGFNQVEVIRQFTGKGLAGFIQKPYTAGRLIDQVRRILAARDPGGDG